MSLRFVEPAAERLPTSPHTSLAALPGNPARSLARSFNLRVILFLLLHIPLAYAMELSPWFSTAHALFISVLGLRAAFRNRFNEVLYLASYVAGAEILWRMTRAHLVWEYGKYITVLIVGVALLVEWRRSGAIRFRSRLPILLLVALLPAAVPTILEFGLSEARDPLSFNLSGHLAFVVLALYLWARPINRVQGVRAMLALMAPVVGIAWLAVFYTLTTKTTTFVLASNWITSGSYGPNQVSNILGLAALLGVILVVIIPRTNSARLVILLLTLVFIAQGLLTFSRGGLYSLVVALIAFGFHLMRTPQARRRFFFLLVMAIIVLTAFIYPSLNQYTGGTLAQRLADLDTTGRLEAAEADLQAFQDYPLVGVGVGLAEDYRAVLLEVPIAAHTEFTRLLAEHGMFGLAAIAILLWILLKRYAANSPGIARALSGSFALWSLSVMTQSATRIVAVSLVLALAVLDWQLDRGAGEDAQPAAGHRTFAQRMGADRLNRLP